MTQLTFWSGPPSNWVIAGTRGTPLELHHGARSVEFGWVPLWNDASWIRAFFGVGGSGFGVLSFAGTTRNGWLGSRSAAAMAGPAAAGAGSTTKATPNARAADTS